MSRFFLDPSSTLLETEASQPNPVINNMASLTHHPALLGWNYRWVGMPTCHFTRVLGELSSGPHTLTIGAIPAPSPQIPLKELSR